MRHHNAEESSVHPAPPRRRRWPLVLLIALALGALLWPTLVTADEEGTPVLFLSPNEGVWVEARLVDARDPNAVEIEVDDGDTIYTYTVPRDEYVLTRDQAERFGVEPGDTRPMCTFFGSSSESQADATYLGPVVALQNNWREAHDAALPGLTWDQALADSAQAWADQLERDMAFMHDRQNLGRTFGCTRFLSESLAGGTSPRDSAQDWLKQRDTYKEIEDMGLTCTPESIGQDNYNACGHYANIVNPSFTHVGCGYVPGLLICRYGAQVLHTADASLD